MEINLRSKLALAVDIIDISSVFNFFFLEHQSTWLWHHWGSNSHGQHPDCTIHFTYQPSRLLSINIDKSIRGPIFPCVCLGLHTFSMWVLEEGHCVSGSWPVCPAWDPRDITHLASVCFPHPRMQQSRGDKQPGTADSGASGPHPLWSRRKPVSHG